MASYGKLTLAPSKSLTQAADHVSSSSQGYARELRASVTRMADLLLHAAFFDEQWPRVSAGLSQVQSAKTSCQLREALQQISADPNFHCVRAGKPDFEAVLDEIPETQEFFDSILPKIVCLAQQAPRFRHKAVPLLVQGKAATASFTYAEAATLLALAFLGLLPGGRPSMAPLYFPKDGCGFPPNTEKLRCFLNYFRQLGGVEGAEVNEDSTERGEVWISRFVDSSHDLEDLRRNSTPLCLCRMQDLRTPIYDSGAALHVDFANASVGGGIFLNAPGATAQEEITFATHPELSLATLLSLPLHDDEALLIRGARRFSRHTGFLDTFAYAGAVKQDEAVLSADVVQIVIDARMYDGAGVPSPYRHDHLRRGML